ncbi:hypothetical protein [Novosphingobium sp.]|uniref:hypothetical protein n=1 Tax=Novosphingobium sp. TaxID=1874826 RepID=UPI003BAC51A6
MNEATFLKLRRAAEVTGYLFICVTPLIFILKSMEYNGRGDDTWQYSLGYGMACVGAAKIFTEATTTSKIVFAVLLIQVALMVLGIAFNI